MNQPAQPSPSTEPTPSPRAASPEFGSKTPEVTEPTLDRRAFTQAAASAVALSVFGSACGCGQTQAGVQPNSRRANLAREPFLAGDPAQYDKIGLYDQYKPEKGVWLVREVEALVALSATCTHLKCTTHWEKEDRRFACPCHHSHFNLQGIQQEGAKARRPLERCLIEEIQTEDGPRVRIDPTKRFRKERGQWEDPRCRLKMPKIETKKHAPNEEDPGGEESGEA